MPVWQPNKLFREWKADLAAQREAERNRTQTIDIGKVDVDIYLNDGSVVQKTLYGHPVLFTWNANDPFYVIHTSVKEVFNGWLTRINQQGFFASNDSDDMTPTREISKITPTFHPHEVTLKLYQEK